MNHLYTACLLAALALSPSAAAQPLPDFGEGAWTWEALGSILRGPSDLVFDWDDRLIVFAAEMYIYDEATQDWIEFDGPRGATLSAIALGRDTLVSGDAFKARSTDGGLTWTEPCVVDFQNICEESHHARPHGTYEIPAGRAYGGRLLTSGRLYSDDRGASWQTATVDADEDGWLFIAEAFASLPSGRVLMAGDWGVATSDDGGASWQLSPLWGPYGVRLYAVAEWATPGSTQAEAAGGPPADCGLADTALCDGAVTVGYDLTDGSEYEQAWWTNDGGRSWTVGSELPQVLDGRGRGLVGILREIDRDGSAEAGTGLGRGLTSLGRGFVYATLDGGQSWTVVARVPFDGPGEISAKHLGVAEIGPDGHLYPAIQNSTDYVYRSVEPASAAFAYLTSDEGAPSAAAASLSVRPNPSDGAVRIEMTLSAPSAGTVEVLDALGRRVAVLHAGPLAAGTRAFTLDAAGWAPGVYTVVARLGGDAVSSRFTVLR